jgi:hypothetical protein
MSIVFWLIGEGITKTVGLKIHKKVTMPTYAYIWCDLQAFAYFSANAAVAPAESF